MRQRIISVFDKLQVPLSFNSYSELNNSHRLFLNSHTIFNLLRIRIRCLKNLARSCVPPLEYTPVSRISILRYTGDCTKMMSVHNLGHAKTKGSQVDTSVCAERYQFRLWYVPFRGSFCYNR
ncbi:hypothetical protein Hanom_Chr06g00545111 [Helianthus anomalus]